MQNDQTSDTKNAHSFSLPGKLQPNTLGRRSFMKRLGLAGAGPRKVITDLGVLEPDPGTCELTLTGVYPGVTVPDVRAKTGWDLAVSASLP